MTSKLPCASVRYILSASLVSIVECIQKEPKKELRPSNVSRPTSSVGMLTDKDVDREPELCSGKCGLAVSPNSWTDCTCAVFRVECQDPKRNPIQTQAGAVLRTNIMRCAGGPV